MPILPPGDLHPTQMTLEQLASLPSGTATGEPVVYFAKDGSIWKVGDVSADPESPFWMQAWHAFDPEPEKGPRRVRRVVA